MKNLVKSYKTSAIGALLVIAGIYTAVTNKSSWTESSVIILTGLPFLGMNDKVFNKT